jgi:hypothetical protein
MIVQTALSIGTVNGQSDIGTLVLIRIWIDQMASKTWGGDFKRGMVVFEHEMFW